jgi:alpha-galactosidase
MTPKKFIQTLLSNKYKMFALNNAHPTADVTYQKTISDDTGTKYFLNCFSNSQRQEISLAQDTGIDFSFECQFMTIIDGKECWIEHKSVQWFNASTGKHKKQYYPDLLEIEKHYEKMWVATGSNYYSKN